MKVDNLISMVSNLMTEWGLKVVGAIIAILLAKMIASWVSNSLRSVLEKRSFDKTLTNFFASMLRYLILVGAGIGILGIFGIETASFAVVLGAAGLAIGMALQGTLGNFAAGVMLLVFRPFKVGDVINVAGVTGSVEALELFTTTLKTPNNLTLIVPNGKVFGDTITNITTTGQRRVDVEVGVDYSANCDDVRKVLEKVPPLVEGGLSDPAPQIFLNSLGGSSVDWQVRVWAKNADYWGVYQEILRHTKAALDEAGIGIPYPQMDVHLDGKLDK